MIDIHWKGAFGATQFEPDQRPIGFWADPVKGNLHALDFQDAKEFVFSLQNGVSETGVITALKSENYHEFNAAGIQYRIDEVYCRPPVSGMTAALVFQIAFFGITLGAGNSIKVRIFFNWVKIMPVSLHLVPAPDMGLFYWMNRARMKTRFGHHFLIKTTTI
ncbi:hypothetical protein N9K64_00220 [Rhodobacteraceae bacterium]|nr:hypothetical protein [Paracoccaceae bacterium]